MKDRLAWSDASARQRLWMVPRALIDADRKQQLERIDRHLVQPAFTAFWGPDTDGGVFYSDLGVDERESLGYLPSPWLALPMALALCRPRRGDVLLDVGSGKGRVLLQAARYPFRRIIGLDQSPMMADLARANIERNRRKLKCQQIELVTADVTDFEIPNDVTTIYCFNSVKGRIFQAMLDRVVALADRRGAPVVLIYEFPSEHDMVMASGRTRLRKAVRAREPLYFSTNIYDVLPAALRE